MAKDWTKLTQADWQERGQHKLEVQRSLRKAYTARLRQKVLSVLGGKCAKCGFIDPRALQIDHPNGGGTFHIKLVGYTMLLRQVLKHPEEFQLLCANCNCIKRIENNEMGPFKGELAKVLLSNPHETGEIASLLEAQGIKG